MKDEKNNSETVDDYLAGLPEEFRTALEKLRQPIRAAAPAAEETVSYGIPAFKYQGVLVSFGAAKNHCALYVMSPTTMAAHKDDLKAYDTSKGTIRFTADKQLPRS